MVLVYHNCAAQTSVHHNAIYIAKNETKLQQELKRSVPFTVFAFVDPLYLRYVQMVRSQVTTLFCDPESYATRELGTFCAAPYSAPQSMLSDTATAGLG